MAKNGINLDLTEENKISEEKKHDPNTTIAHFVVGNEEG
jgi:hypothetical protein